MDGLKIIQRIKVRRWCRGDSIYGDNDYDRELESGAPSVEARGVDSVSNRTQPGGRLIVLEESG